MSNKLAYLILGFFFTLTLVKAQAQAPPPPQPDKRAPLTAEQIEEALEFAEQFDPKLVEQLEELKIDMPERFNREVRHLLREKRRLERLQKRDQTRYEQVLNIQKMEIQSHVMGQQYQEAEESEKAQIKTELKSLLAKLFELRSQDRQEEVKRLEKQLDELKQSLAAREKNKEQIIERRLQQLTGEKSYLEW
ncbi:MAG: hypothetical protein ACE5HS_20370 [bacterium]